MQFQYWVFSTKFDLIIEVVKTSSVIWYQA